MTQNSLVPTPLPKKMSVTKCVFYPKIVDILDACEKFRLRRITLNIFE
jgi:hypothetical protein